MKRRQVLSTIALTLLSASMPAAASAEGVPIDLSVHSGKIVLADFWASWCGPCRQSFPWLNNMSAKYQDRGLHVIGINLDADSQSAEQFLAKYPAQFEILFDPKGEHASFYDLKTMPTSLLFDRSGNLAMRHNGFLSNETDDYEAKLVKLLAN